MPDSIYFSNSCNRRNLVSFLNNIKISLLHIVGAFLFKENWKQRFQASGATICSSIISENDAVRREYLEKIVNSINHIVKFQNQHIDNAMVNYLAIYEILDLFENYTIALLHFSEMGTSFPKGWEICINLKTWTLEQARSWIIFRTWASPPVRLSSSTKRSTTSIAMWIRVFRFEETDSRLSGIRSLMICLVVEIASRSRPK